MTFELALTPAGRIAVRRSDSDQQGGGGQTSNGRLAKVATAFDSSPAEGLFALAVQRLDASAAPSLGYWRDFAALYLSRLCQTPEVAGTEIEEVPPPSAGELATMLLCVPPMPGAEYVSADGLMHAWHELDEWVRAQVVSHSEGLAGFLKERAPLWHQVGRVCFHLAENRRDPDCPFAFMATYAPSLTSGGRVKYQPLSKALEQYAGAKNKSALIKLLSPVHLASKASRLVGELVESGDLFQPLAWSPQQAHRFLKEVPLFEESGILVRLPNWWKHRPRPQVSVTIGDKRQSKFDAKGILDFKVQLALGDQKLSAAEWRELAAGDEGLVLLRGQWVEVDREKLTEALDHWNQVEKHADGGLSFIDGMRLLAGAPMDLGEDSQPEAADREWSFVDAGKWLGKILADLRSPQDLGRKESAGELRATLREYQQTGVNWLSFLSSLGLGACLADDMGLGKTIQVLALLLALKKKKVRKPSLLVLPASLLSNWKTEIDRFAPSLRTQFVHSSRLPKTNWPKWQPRPARP